MILPTSAYPDPDEERKVFDPLANILYEGLELATAKSCEYLESDSEKINPYIHADLTRWHLKQFLLPRAASVFNVSVDYVQNNGLVLRNAGRVYRIWKYPHEQWPVAGTTQAKLNFLRQHHQVPMNFGATDGVLAIPNRTIHWLVDHRYRLSGLVLSCPRWATRVSSETYFSIPIPHPISQSKPQPDAAAVNSAQFDLGLQLTDEEVAASTQEES